LLSQDVVCPHKDAVPRSGTLSSTPTEPKPTRIIWNKSMLTQIQE
jgi:hypothetical protein